MDRGLFLEMGLGALAGTSSTCLAAKPWSHLALRVFLAATSLEPAYGGPAYSVSRLAFALADAGADVGLWSAYGSVTDTRLLQKSAVTQLNGGGVQALRSFAADLVHDNGLWLAHNHRLATASGMLRLPRLVSTRGMLEPWARRHKRWKKDIAWLAYQRRDLRHAAGLHATAPQEAEHLKQLGLDVPVHVIPNGVDVPPHLDVQPAGEIRTALFLGRLYPVKGLPMLVEAWACTMPSGWRLVLAGPDEAGHRAELEALIAKRGLEAVITFAGPLDGEAKARALFGADLFILPSHSESFGMAIAEALAHGVPVLTTVGAPWPALTERGMGWRTEISADGLAAALADATAQDLSTLRAMGQRGRDYVASEFGWDRVARQFLATYEQIIAKSTAGAPEG